MATEKEEKHEITKISVKTESSTETTSRTKESSTKSPTTSSSFIIFSTSDSAEKQEEVPSTLADHSSTSTSKKAEEAQQSAKSSTWFTTAQTTSSDSRKITHGEKETDRKSDKITKTSEVVIIRNMSSTFLNNSQQSEENNVENQNIHLKYSSVHPRKGKTTHQMKLLSLKASSSIGDIETTYTPISSVDYSSLRITGTTVPPLVANVTSTSNLDSEEHLRSTFTFSSDGKKFTNVNSEPSKEAKISTLQSSKELSTSTLQPSEEGSSSTVVQPITKLQVSVSAKNVVDVLTKSEAGVKTSVSPLIPKFAETTTLSTETSKITEPLSTKANIDTRSTLQFKIPEKEDDETTYSFTDIKSSNSFSTDSEVTSTKRTALSKDAGDKIIRTIAPTNFESTSSTESQELIIQLTSTTTDHNRRKPTIFATLPKKIPENSDFLTKYSVEIGKTTGKAVSKAKIGDNISTNIMTTATHTVEKKLSTKTITERSSTIDINPQTLQTTTEKTEKSDISQRTLEIATESSTAKTSSTSDEFDLEFVRVTPPVPFTSKIDELTGTEPSVVDITGEKITFTTISKPKVTVTSVAELSSLNQTANADKIRTTEKLDSIVTSTSAVFSNSSTKTTNQLELEQSKRPTISIQSSIEEETITSIVTTTLEPGKGTKHSESSTVIPTTHSSDIRSTGETEKDIQEIHKSSTISTTSKTWSKVPQSSLSSTTHEKIPYIEQDRTGATTAKKIYLSSDTLESTTTELPSTGTSTFIASKSRISLVKGTEEKISSSSTTIRPSDETAVFSTEIDSAENSQTLATVTEPVQLSLPYTTISSKKMVSKQSSSTAMDLSAKKTTVNDMEVLKLIKNNETSTKEPAVYLFSSSPGELTTITKTFSTVTTPEHKIKTTQEITESIFSTSKAPSSTKVGLEISNSGESKKFDNSTELGLEIIQVLNQTTTNTLSSMKDFGSNELNFESNLTTIALHISPSSFTREVTHDQTESSLSTKKQATDGENGSANSISFATSTKQSIPPKQVTSETEAPSKEPGAIISKESTLSSTIKSDKQSSTAEPEVLYTNHLTSTKHEEDSKTTIDNKSETYFRFSTILPKAHRKTSSTVSTQGSDSSLTTAALEASSIRSGKIVEKHSTTAENPTYTVGQSTVELTFDEQAQITYKPNEKLSSTSLPSKSRGLAGKGSSKKLMLSVVEPTLPQETGATGNGTSLTVSDDLVLVPVEVSILLCFIYRFNS